MTRRSLWLSQSSGIADLTGFTLCLTIILLTFLENTAACELVAVNNSLLGLDCAGTELTAASHL